LQLGEYSMPGGYFGSKRSFRDGKGDVAPIIPLLQETRNRLSPFLLPSIHRTKNALHRYIKSSKFLQAKGFINAPSPIKCTARISVPQILYISK
jgi:hypothetical protein